jgi:hypothetical protein
MRRGEARCESGCSQQAGTLDVSVQNAGPEIDAKHLPRLFDRFYRVDSARRHLDGSEGPGRGLAIVKAIVKAHGGSVRATSALGLTCIFIQLPLPQRRSAKGRSEKRANRSHCVLQIQICLLNHVNTREVGSSRVPQKSFELCLSYETICGCAAVAAPGDERLISRHIGAVQENDADQKQSFGFCAAVPTSTRYSQHGRFRR